MIATRHFDSGKTSLYFLRGFNLDHRTNFSASVDAMPVNRRTRSLRWGQYVLISTCTSPP